MRGQFLQTKWARPISCPGRRTVVWIRSFTEPDLFDNNVPFDNTTPIYLINLLWKLGLGLGFDLSCTALFSHFFAKNNENEHLIFREFYVR